VTITSDTGRAAHLDLRVPDAGVLTTADILKSFNRLRRELSCIVSGTDGLSLGYDVQEYTASTLAGLAPGTRVAVSAHVSDLLPHRHLVEFVATVPLPSHLDRASEVSLIARCRGWTSTARTPRREPSPPYGADLETRR